MTLRLLLFFAFVSITGCGDLVNKGNSGGTYVSMRDFGSESNTSLSIQAKAVNGSSTSTSNVNEDEDEDKDGILVTSNIDVSLSSSIYCEDEVISDCECNASNVNLSQIFIKPDDIDSGGHTFIYKNGKPTGDNHDFSENDVIGIDIDYKGDYVRMSDIYIFDQDEDGKFPFKEGVAEDIFIHEKNESHAVSFDFPIGSSQYEPTVSTTGCWMKIVLDFN